MNLSELILISFSKNSPDVVVPDVVVIICVGNEGFVELLQVVYSCIIIFMNDVKRP